MWPPSVDVASAKPLKWRQFARASYATYIASLNCAWFPDPARNLRTVRLLGAERGQDITIDHNVHMFDWASVASVACVVFDPTISSILNLTD